jgi:hypothetical protein
MASGDLTATSPTTSQMNASVFDGVDDYVEIPHNAAQLGANLSNGFTISAWINPRSGGEGDLSNIIDKSTGTSGNGGFKFYYTTGGSTNRRIAFQLNAGTAKTCATNTILYGTWYHVLVTISSGQLANFYVNGTLSGTANQDLVQTISTITTTNAMRIGNRATETDRTFDGSIRSVKMWNRVLTSAEITADYNGQDPNRSHLIHEFKLEKDYTDTGRIGVAGTNSGSYFNKTNANAIVGDVRQLNLAAVTDKLRIIPVTNMNKRFIVVGTNRAA